MALYDNLFNGKDLDVVISELLVATADGYDAGVDRKITAVLEMLRKQLGMDVVFVSEFVDGQRVFRFVDGSDNNPGVHVNDAAPLEESYCQRVVQGRMPELVHDASAVAAELKLPHTPIRVGAHLSTPVQLPDGRVYGTLCCFSAQPNPALNGGDLERLRQCARLVARKVNVDDRPDFEPTAPGWSTLSINAKLWNA